MQKAFHILRKTSVEQRQQELKKLRQKLLEEKNTIINRLSQTCGKPKTDAALELIGTMDWGKWLEDHAHKFLKTKKAPTPITLLGKKSLISHEPLGVVLIIAPWNYPLHIGLTQIMTAFVCGNSVIYKPSEVSPMKGFYESLLEVSPLLSQSVEIQYGDGDLGKKLIDQKPNKIFFTGSTKTGIAISKQAAEHLIPVDLELGGKDAMVVFPGSNIQRAASAAVWGAFTHSGQSCSSVERLYVHKDIEKEMTQEIVKKTQDLLRDENKENSDLGSMSVGFQLEIVKEHLQDARFKGAKILTGGEVIDKDKLQYAPTVIQNTKPEMKVIGQETFGPVLPIISFSTEEEVVSLVNESEFGLQASVFSPDKDQAFRVAKALEVGGVSINNVNMVEGNPWLSFGGCKQSGTGRARGVEGLHAFTRSKYYLIDPNSKKIEANWYPYTQSKYNQFQKFIKALFVDSPLRLLKVALTGLKLESMSQKGRDE